MLALRALCLALCALLLAPLLPGCAWIAKMGTDRRGTTIGKTYYLGGAGPFGHVGSFDVPEGLRQGGYRGAIEVVPWQSWIGWTIRDQIDRQRNEAQAQRLADEMLAYMRDFPGRPVNVIALSAGTGIATWAIEKLPPGTRLNNVVFFASSLSRTYDLSRMLSRLDGRLYSFYSPADPILRYAVPIAGSVDREFVGSGVGGLSGFSPPPNADRREIELYNDRLRNMPWRRGYSRYDYDGNHTDATSTAFVRRIVTPLVARVGRPEGPSPVEPPADAPPPVAAAGDANAPLRPGAPIALPLEPTTRPAESAPAEPPALPDAAVP